MLDSNATTQAGASTLPTSFSPEIMKAAIAVFTPDLCKASRRELGLSQAELIKTSGMPQHKVKMFEARGLVLDVQDRRKLVEYFLSRGVDLVELADYNSTKAGPPPKLHDCWRRPKIDQQSRVVPIEN